MCAFHGMDKLVLLNDNPIKNNMTLHVMVMLVFSLPRYRMQAKISSAIINAAINHDALPDKICLMMLVISMFSP